MKLDEFMQIVGPMEAVDITAEGEGYSNIVTPEDYRNPHHEENFRRYLEVKDKEIMRIGVGWHAEIWIEFAE
jgi:hypothetical protein